MKNNVARIALICAMVPLLVLPPLVTGTASAHAQASSAARSAADPFAAHVAEASQRFGIPEDWIRIVLHAESTGDDRAISPAGAMGLMQVMPATWAELRDRHQLGDDPYEPRANVLAGAAYLREMWDRYGDIAAMLSAYNAGPGRYDEHVATGRALPAETRAYVDALAPRLGASPSAKAVVAGASRSADWRDAPLFIAQPPDGRATDPAQSGGEMFVMRSPLAGSQ